MTNHLFLHSVGPKQSPGWLLEMWKSGGIGPFLPRHQFPTRILPSRQNPLVPVPEGYSVQGTAK